MRFYQKKQYSQVLHLIILFLEQQRMNIPTSFNPEETAKIIMNRSFLNSRQISKETGSKFFHDNKVKSCSYVKDTKSGRKAVPFYDKRDNVIYPTKSTLVRSWTSSVHSNKGIQHAGMGTAKPLTAYNPSLSRNSMFIEDFRPPYPNSSKIEVGERSKRDVKHYLTTYKNDFIAKNRQQVPTNHPGIQAFRNKWLRSRIQL